MKVSQAGMLYNIAQSSAELARTSLSAAEEDGKSAETIAQLKADADQKDLEADEAYAAKAEAEKELEEAKAIQEQGKQTLAVIEA